MIKFNTVNSHIRIRDIYSYSGPCIVMCIRIRFIAYRRSPILNAHFLKNVTMAGPAWLDPLVK